MNSFFRSAVRWCCTGLLSLGAISLSGCGTPQYAFSGPDPAGVASPTGSTPVSVPAPSDSASSSNSLGADWLSPGNKITITYSGIINAPPKHEEKVREDGYISPPLLGRPVMAAGKTIGQLQEELQKLYVPDYFTRALTVTVATEERWFFVGGDVRNPNRYLYSGQMTVLKAVQTAGGFTEFAKRTRVQITRADGRKETPVNCDKAVRNPKLDLAIFPGDQIFVDRRKF